MMFGLMRNNDFCDGYNPFREMENLERSAFRDFFGSHDLAEFKTDLTDEGDYFLLEADLPGFKKEDIRLELQGNNLVVSAERHSNAEEKNKDGKVIHMERSCGSYTRSFDITGINADHIRASYQDGVLKLMLPKENPELPEKKVLQIE